MIWQISVAVVAVAFVVLVVYLIKTLKAAEQSLLTTTTTLQEVQKTIDELGVEVKQIVKQANDLTGDLQHKMKQIDPVLESVKNAGEVLNEVTLATKQVSVALAGRIKSRKRARREAAKTAIIPRPEVQPPAVASPHEASASKPAGWMKWVDVAADVWQKYRD
ncbi:DUF948 domain-containing protein [Paenibacillus sanguinis]|uniref:DUF948 domain-containing protein n=1 Tax=Paenibacillus sanguinis TaxID=225906 RepID=UPI00037A1519|nr:DUF948 domain-containing protein [Paenibacillus sanguinis]